MFTRISVGIYCHDLKSDLNVSHAPNPTVTAGAAPRIFARGGKAKWGLHPEGASWQKGPPFEILSYVLKRRISEARTLARRILLC